MKRLPSMMAASALLATIPVFAQVPESGDGQEFRTIPAWSDAGAADARTGIAPAAPMASLSYFHILGATLKPRDSVNTYVYAFNGCIYVSGGLSGRLQFPVTVPDGSTIKFLRIYYNDTNASVDLTAWLTQYTPGQSSIDLTSISSSGSAGFGTALSPEISHVVDNQLNYTINVGWGASNTTQQICGVRVAYYAP
jgi:hypothetical protein